MLKSVRREGLRRSIFDLVLCVVKMQFKALLQGVLGNELMSIRIDVFWKLAHKLYEKNLSRTARLIGLLSYIIGSHSVSVRAKIGEGTVFHHHAVGCVIHPRAIIGKHCNIYQNVTIGQKLPVAPAEISKRSKNNVPIIKNDVFIGAGAVILGGIIIGDNAKIGANSVVLHDIPKNATAVGIPARVICKRNVPPHC